MPRGRRPSMASSTSIRGVRRLLRAQVRRTRGALRHATGGRPEARSGHTMTSDGQGGLVIFGGQSENERGVDTRRDHMGAPGHGQLRTRMFTKRHCPTDVQLFETAANDGNCSAPLRHEVATGCASSIVSHANQPTSNDRYLYCSWFALLPSTLRTLRTVFRDQM